MSERRRPDTVSSESFERYLRVLGVSAAAPTLDSLERLVRAELIRVPFENISKLHSARTLGIREMPDLDRFLDGIEGYNFGGTCYPTNYHFCSLLRHLGFDASFCGADMPSGPDVHTVILVRVEGAEYHVDVGYGAPFYAPLRRDLAVPQEIPFGNERFVLGPRDARGRSRMDHHRGEEIIHYYIAKPTPRTIEHFDRVIRESYADEATFMNAVRLTRFMEYGSVSIRNHTLFRATPRHYAVEKLPDRGAIVDAVVRHFAMPREIVREALDGIEKLRGVHD